MRMASASASASSFSPPNRRYSSSSSEEKKSVQFRTSTNGRISPPSPPGPWSYAVIQKANTKKDYRVDHQIRFVSRPEAISADANRKLPSSSIRFAIWSWAIDGKDELNLDTISYEKIVQCLKYLDRYAIHQTRLHKFRQLQQAIFAAAGETENMHHEIINTPIQSASFAWAKDPDSIMTSQPWNTINRDKGITSHPLIITVTLPTVEAAQKMITALTNAAKQISSLALKFIPLEQRYFRFRMHAPIAESVQEIKTKLKAIGFGDADASYWIENDDGQCHHISYRADRTGAFSRRRLTITAPMAFHSLLTHEYFDQLHNVQVWMQPSLKTCNRCGLLGRSHHQCNSHYCDYEFQHDNRQLCLGCGTHSHNHTAREHWQQCITHANKSLGCIFCGQHSHTSTLCRRHVSTWLPLFRSQFFNSAASPVSSKTRRSGGSDEEKENISPRSSLSNRSTSSAATSLHSHPSSAGEYTPSRSLRSSFAAVAAAAATTVSTASNGNMTNNIAAAFPSSPSALSLSSSSAVSTSSAAAIESLLKEIQEMKKENQAREQQMRIDFNNREQALMEQINMLTMQMKELLHHTAPGLLQTPPTKQTNTAAMATSAQTPPVTQRTIETHSPLKHKENNNKKQKTSSSSSSTNAQSTAPSSSSSSSSSAAAAAAAPAAAATSIPRARSSSLPVSNSFTALSNTEDNMETESSTASSAVSSSSSSSSKSTDHDGEKNKSNRSSGSSSGPRQSSRHSAVAPGHSSSSSQKKNDQQQSADDHG